MRMKPVAVLDVAADLMAGGRTDLAQVMRMLVNACAAARGLTPPWPVDLPEEDAERAMKRLADLDGLDTWGAAELGDAYQRLLTGDERASGGVYYTPPELAEHITMLALRTQLDQLPDVMVFDPSCGAGVFLLATADLLAVGRARAFTGSADPPDFAVQAALGEVLRESVFGADIDPIAVEIARSACWLAVGGVRPIGFMDDNIICADPLTGALPPALAARLDSSSPLIVLGNPPYLEQAKGLAPWIEARRAKGELALRPSLDEFRTAGQGRYEGKLSNLYTFFWRLATWLAFDRRPGRPGTVAFVTPSAYLRSEVFAGMREYLRRTADQGWIVDLSPEGHQPPVPTRIFPEVKTPLAVGVFTRRRGGDSTVPAVVRHRAVAGRREEKLRQLAAVDDQGGRS